MLAGFNLTIKAGETVALVGHTGAGKSSLGKLVARFYEFQGGEILIDGRDIRTFDLHAYHRRLGIVPQVPFLFSGTVADNIRYARPQATDEEVAAVAQNIGWGDWLEALPNGLDTEVGVGTLYSAWYVTVGAVLGFQYPWRVTPFVEGRFTAGLIGASYMGQSAVSYLYVGGIEGGAEFYLVSRFHVTASVGWAHPVFSGIDVDYVKAHPMLDPARKDFAADTFTFKIGLGL